MKKKSVNKIIIRYSIYFIIFSSIGSLVEYLFGFFGGTGIAYYRSLYELFNIKIYFIPFYGMIGVILILFGRVFDRKKINIYYKGLLNGLLIIAWELIGGLFTIGVFGHNMWNYTEHLLNFKGIISVRMSLLWIAAGYVFSWIYEYAIKRFEK